MGDFIVLLLASFIGLGVGLMSAYNITSNNIKYDCDKVGAFIISNKVYDCKERK